MNNNLMIFENPEFGAVRSILIDSDPWFVAADVCKALELEKNKPGFKQARRRKGCSFSEHPRRQAANVYHL